MLPQKIELDFEDNKFINSEIMASDTNKDTHSNSNSLKWVSLFTLTFQNAILALSMRYARTQPGDLFLSSSAVAMAELLKLITCLVIIVIEEGSVIKAVNSLKNTIIKQPVDTLKVSVPSFVYTVQNNMLYVAASNLDAATYQVTYQLKILTTAVFAVFLLRKSLHPIQWLSLVILIGGVSIVQLSGSPSNSSTGGHDQSPLIGLLAVIASCCMSGFAGVYFEKILKGSDVSVWIRNIQLSFLGIPFALITCFISDGEAVTTHGFFFGYNAAVWFVISMQACGGLLVAVVVKYADNILKGFATSMAIIVACVVSVYLFDFVVSIPFVLGTGLVILSVFLYGSWEGGGSAKMPGYSLLRKV